MIYGLICTLKKENLLEFVCFGGVCVLAGGLGRGGGGGGGKGRWGGGGGEGGGGERGGGGGGGGGGGEWVGGR